PDLGDYGIAGAIASALKSMVKPCCRPCACFNGLRIRQDVDIATWIDSQIADQLSGTKIAGPHKPRSVRLQLGEIGVLISIDSPRVISIVGRLKSPGRDWGTRASSAGNIHVALPINLNG